MNEYYNNILEIIEKIAVIDSEIYKKYEQVKYLEFNKNYLLDYDEKINVLISDIFTLKIEENDLYSKIENNIAFISLALKYLRSVENNEMSDEARLIFRRIKANLQLLITLCSFEDIVDIKFNNLKDLYLIDNGISKNDVLLFKRKFKYDFEKSLSYRYITCINEEIKNNNDEKRNMDLIKIKLNWAFSIGNEVEDELLKTKFTTVPNKFNSELSNFNLDPILFNNYLDMEVIDYINLNLSYLTKLTPSLKTTELINEFKSLILYLSDKTLKTLKKVISKTYFKAPIIRDMLLICINNRDKDLIIHNSDINKGRNI